MNNVVVTEVCSWFHMGREDDIHALFEYIFVREVWEAVGLQQWVAVRNNDTALEVLKRVFNAGTGDQGIMVGLLCWSIWCRKNKWVWDKVIMLVFGVRAMAMNLLADWNRAREDDCKYKNQQPGGTVHWCKPSVGWIKVNVDATCKPGVEFVGVGCVILDDEGKFIRARSSRIRGIIQPRMAEALSLREALSLAKQWRHGKCIFECDAKLIVDAANGRKFKSMFDTIVEDCCYMLKHFEEVLVTFVHRSANIVAIK